MFSPNMVVDGFTWKEVTGPGTTLRKYNMDTIIVLMHILYYANLSNPPQFPVTVVVDC